MKQRHDANMVDVMLLVYTTSISTIKDSMIQHQRATSCLGNKCPECCFRCGMEDDYTQYGCVCNGNAKTEDILKWLIKNRDYWEAID